MPGVYSTKTFQPLDDTSRGANICELMQEQIYVNQKPTMTRRLEYTNWLTQSLFGFRSTVLYIYSMEKRYKKSTSVYGLKCSYYHKTFNSIMELVDDVVTSGMDPNVKITRNGKVTNERPIDLIQYQASVIVLHIFTK